MKTLKQVAEKVVAFFFAEDTERQELVSEDTNEIVR